VRAQALLAAGGPVTVVVGRQSVAESAEWVADAAASLRRDLPEARFLTALRRANVHGALDMGLTPGFLPGRVDLDEGRAWFAEAWPTLPERPGLDTTGMLAAAAAGRLDVLILLGADPLADFPDRNLATRALEQVGTVIALDLFLTESAGRAAVVLPAAGFAEVAGTTTNLEGRVSPLHQQVTPPGTARTDWMIAAELAFLLGTDLQLESNAQIWDEITRLAPAYAGLGPELAGRAADDGVPLPLPRTAGAADGSTGVDDAEGPDAAAGSDTAGDAAGSDAAEGGEATGAPSGPDLPGVHTFVPGEPLEPVAVDAYGLRLVASRKLYDQGTLVQQSPSLAPLAPGTTLRVNAYDFARMGVRSGSQVRVKTAVGALEATVEVDDTVPRGTAAVFVNQDGIRIGDLIDATQRVTDLRIDVGGAPT
jgi:NADH-quinone oxidoreductase subunit G